MTSVLAIVGGGQLGRMLALAAAPLGIRTRVLDPSPDACAGDVADLIVGRFDDPQAIAQLVADADAVTFEFESVPTSVVAEAQASGLHMRPGIDSLRIASDRLAEKQHLASIGIDIPPYREVSDLPTLRRAVESIGTPSILKSRKGGYDGKGQAPINDASEAESAWEAIGRRPAVLESRVAFARECSVLVVRSADGDTAAYPVVENIHRDGILRTSIAPAVCDEKRASQAVRWATRAAASLDHVGVFTLELFETEHGWLANEFAPRVHNSGHWTIEGAETSQFENHVRAVMGLPLGSTSPRCCAVMLNIIGDPPDRATVLAADRAHLHLYGKAAKLGRKLGHVTCLGDTPGSTDAAAEALAPLVPGCR